MRSRHSAVGQRHSNLRHDEHQFLHSILLEFNLQPAGADHEGHGRFHSRGQFHHQQRGLCFRGRLWKRADQQPKQPGDLDETAVLSAPVSDYSHRSRELLRFLPALHQNNSPRIGVIIMNTTLTRNRKPEEGSSLFLVMILIVIAFMMLASALSWSSNNALTIARNGQYWRTVGAAEAATEKVLSHFAWDFQGVNGENTVYGALNAGTYRNLVPSAGENSYWNSYIFSDGLGNSNQTDVTLVPGSRTNWTALNSQYAGLFGVTDSYQVKSYSRETQGRFNVSAGVQQNVQLATIPLFQFAIFYNVDLEIEPGPNMTVTGRVHGNHNIYQNPAASLTYESHVTAAGNIISGPIPGDPGHSGPSGGSVTYKGEHDSKVGQLTLPISSGSDSDTVYEILKPPPAGGDSDATLAKERYYNKVDIIIRVSDPPAGSPPGTPPVVTGTSGAYNLLATSVNVGSFVGVSTNRFYNGRELKGVNAIDIDVGNFKSWADNSAGGASSLWTLYGREPNSIYVVDNRSSVPAGTEPGVRLVNGSQLPAGGLTVATPN